MVHTLVLMRHGESTWNQENKFTGWTDVPLSETGLAECKYGAEALKKSGLKFDYVYTSYLKRAIDTMNETLKGIDQQYLPVEKTWRLNERHYGALQGLNKAETAAKHGEEQVKIWRRAYNIPPPALEKSDPRWAGNEALYAKLPKDVCPTTECLADCIARVLPAWFDGIAPKLLDNKTVLIVAHGNSLRGLIKHLDNCTEAEILELNVPTAVPLVYELDDDLKPIKHYYLMSDAELKAKIDAVANQGKAK